MGVDLVEASVGALLVAKAAQSAARDMDVRELLANHQDLVDTLGLDLNRPVTLIDLANRVASYWDRRKRSPAAPLDTPPATAPAAGPETGAA